MRSCLVASALLFVTSAPTCASQSSNPGGQSGSDTVKSVAQSSAASGQDPAERTKKKPKKVWTNDEISTRGGIGSVSVVGNSADTDTKPSSKDDSTQTTNASPLKERQVAAYRNRLHQLHIELETTEKKISELRNFKADNTSASGGINMNHRYSMTPVEDQVKRLEEKKKQLQIQIDAVEDQARKNGVEPGELR
jgi:hypothetical protein